MQVSYSFIQRSQRSIVKRQNYAFHCVPKVSPGNENPQVPEEWRRVACSCFRAHHSTRCLEDSNHGNILAVPFDFASSGASGSSVDSSARWWGLGLCSCIAGGQGVWIFFMEPSFRTPFDVPFVHNFWASPRSMSISISPTLWTQLRAWKLPSSGDPQGPCISPEGFQAYAFHRGWIWLVHGDTASTFWYLLIFFDHWLVYICLSDLPALLMDLMESDENHWMTKIRRKQILHVTRECRSNQHRDSIYGFRPSAVGHAVVDLMSSSSLHFFPGFCPVDFLVLFSPCASVVPQNDHWSRRSMPRATFGWRYDKLPGWTYCGGSDIFLIRFEARGVHQTHQRGGDDVL